MPGWIEWPVSLIVIGATLTGLEAAFPLDAERRRIPWRDRRSDMRWFVLYLLWGPLVGLAIARAIDAITAGTDFGVRGAPAIVQVIVALAAYDLTSYWVHRAMHHWPTLWRWHAVHHRAAELRWSTAFRFHPLSGIPAHVVPLAAAIGTGASTTAIAVVITITFIVTIFGHLDGWCFAGRIEHVLAVPSFHRRHHAEASTEQNFSLVFSIFDHAFGTWAGLSPDEQATDQHRHAVGDRTQLQAS